jgi:hypothetical protein
MGPQQVRFQLLWLGVFEHTWICPFAICYRLFATSVALPTHPLGYWLSAITQNLIDDRGVPGADGVSL